MLKIQYAPYIDDTIAAFTRKKQENGKYLYKIDIPFRHNVAISRVDFDCMYLKLKSAQSNQIYVENLEHVSLNENSDIVTFEFTLKKDLYVGQYYKIQIAYGKKVVENNKKEIIVGEYSQNEIVKLAHIGQVSIKDMKKNELNMRQTYFKGQYVTSDEDPHEKEEKYEFILYDDKDGIVDRSGILIHNTENEYDEWYYAKDLKPNKSYYIEYIVYTINSLSATSGRYEIEDPVLPPMEFNITLNPVLDMEEGRIRVYIKDINTEDDEDEIQGFFCLSRAIYEGEDELKEWTILQNFMFNNKSIRDGAEPLYNDYYIEQGVVYVYGIQRYNIHGIYSDRIESNYVVADFEHMYLIDPDGSQLKIKYNPNISSFKNTVLETKIDTIGGNFPFVFRNKKVKYKEMNISGLLSYLSDDNKMFYRQNFFDKNQALLNINSKGEYIKSPTPMTSFFDERQFKLKALEWLNNGEVKVLKTPSEGNYIVRLMNVSFTPEKVTGRMLHSFSATAYEIEEYNSFNLLKFNFIKLRQLEADVRRVHSLKSVNLFNCENFEKTLEKNYYLSEELINEEFQGKVNYFQIVGAKPGTRFEIHIVGGEASQQFMIGMTGEYRLNLGDNNVYSLKLLGKLQDENDEKKGFIRQTGILSYNNKAIQRTPFDSIKEVKNRTVYAKTFYGSSYTISSNRNIVRNNLSIVSNLNDIKRTFGYWLFINFKRRPIKSLETINSKDIVTKFNNISPSYDKYNVPDYYLYFYNGNFYEKIYYLNNKEELTYVYFKLNISNEEELYQVKMGKYLINSSIQQYSNFIVQKNQEYRIDINNYFDTNEIIIGPGIAMDGGYRFVEVEYDVETSTSSVKNIRKNYEKYAFPGSNKNNSNYNWIIYKIKAEKYYKDLINKITPLIQ